MLCFLREKLPVHVVVDPILSKVLRPHQREVNGGGGEVWAGAVAEPERLSSPGQQQWGAKGG